MEQYGQNDGFKEEIAGFEDHFETGGIVTDAFLGFFYGLFPVFDDVYFACAKASAAESDYRKENAPTYQLVSHQVHNWKGKIFLPYNQGTVRKNTYKIAKTTHNTYEISRHFGDELIINGTSYDLLDYDDTKRENNNDSSTRKNSTKYGSNKAVPHYVFDTDDDDIDNYDIEGFYEDNRDIFDDYDDAYDYFEDNFDDLKDDY